MLRTTPREKTVTNPGGRLHALDGLRGIAALIVVAYHAATTWTLYALEVQRAIPTGDAFSPLWWITATPLSLFFAGGEAVLVFFALSGMAVILPVLKRGTAFDWIAYYPRRVVRILLPAAASVVLAAVWAFSTANVAGRLIEQPNPVLRSNIPMVLNWQPFVRSLDVSSGEMSVNSPLWSLNWEMWFSMALPLFAIAAFLIRGRWAIWTAVAGVAVSWLGYQVNALAFAYLAPFLIGALVAGNLTALRAWAARVNASRGGLLLWAGIIVFALFCIGLPSWTYAWTGTTETWAKYTGGFTTIGAGLLVVAAILCRPVGAFLETRPIQWLGKISFSLYLVHLPILSTVGVIVGTDHWVRATAIAVPIAFVVAILFQRFVEAPSHILSKRIGSSISAKVRARSDAAKAEAAAA